MYINVYVMYMVQAMINISENTNQVLNILKAKFGLKDKSETINFVVNEYENKLLEPELRPKFIKRLDKISKEKGIPFKNIKELRKMTGE